MLGGMKCRSSAAALIGMCVATGASAETLTLNFDGLHFGNDSLTARTSLTGSTQFYAGAINWSEPGSGQAFTTFCIEVTQLVSDPTTFTVQTAPDGTGWFDNDPTDTLLRARLLQNLYNEFYASASLNEATSAAFQLAVWEIVYEDLGSDGNIDLDVNDGGFEVTGGSVTAIDPVLNLSAASLANAWLSQLNTDGTPVSGLQAWTSNDGQNQLWLIPLPGPAAMGLAGMLGLAVARRRRD